MNRRKSLAVLASAPLAGMIAPKVFGQTSNPSWQSQLNQTIVQDLHDTSARIFQTFAAGTIHASDVLVMAHSFEVWVRHVHQIGAEPSIGHELQSAFDAPLTSDALEALRQSVYKVASGSRVESAFAALQHANTHSNMQAIKSSLANGGVWAMHQAIGQWLELYGNRLEQHGGILNAATGELPGGAHLSLVDNWNACAAGAVAGLYLATWGVMGSVGYASLAFLTGGTAFALLGLGAAVYGVLCM